MTITPSRCWRPGCHADAPWQFGGHDWTLRACGDHLRVPRAVTGKEAVRIRTWRDGREVLFDVEAGGGR